MLLVLVLTELLELLGLGRRIRLLRAGSCCLPVCVLRLMAAQLVAGVKIFIKGHCPLIIVLLE